jgi:hypothetical protein
MRTCTEAMSQDVPARMAGARTLHIMSYQNDNHETIHPFEERSAGSALSDIAEQPMLTRYAYVITNKATVTSDNGPIGGISILAHATQEQHSQAQSERVPPQQCWCLTNSSSMHCVGLFWGRAQSMHSEEDICNQRHPNES